MNILITGSRDWTNAEVIKSQLVKLPSGSIVIHGACRGADLLAANIAKELGFEVKSFPADWDTFGKSAGPIRNREMLCEEPDLVLAFHDDLEKSKGTRDMVKIALDTYVPTILIDSNGVEIIFEQAIQETLL